MAFGVALLAVAAVTGCGAKSETASGLRTNWVPAASDSASASPAGSPSAALSPSPSTTSAASPTTAPANTNTNVNLAAVKGKTIAVDPGHNGGNASHTAEINKQVPMGTGTKACDTTGTETNAGYQEAAFTFDVATRLAALLRAAGANVVMTRTNNTGVGPCVNERAAVGNDAHADAAVSIHGDGAPASGRGFHVLEPAKVGAPSDVIIAPSHQLALKIRDNYRSLSGVPASNYIGTNGINTRSDMGGLNLSTVPKVMVECGNMRNSTDAGLMSSATERQKMAEGLAAGIAAFLAS